MVFHSRYTRRREKRVLPKEEQRTGGFGGGVSSSGIRELRESVGFLERSVFAMEAEYRKKEDADLTERQSAYRSQEDPVP